MLYPYVVPLATVSVRLAKHEDRFDIEIPLGLDLEDVAREYESYGHRVDRDVSGRRLCVLSAVLP